MNAGIISDDAEDRHDEVLEEVELVAPLAEVEADGRHVDGDVHAREQQPERVADEDVRRQRAAGSSCPRTAVRGRPRARCRGRPGNGPRSPACDRLGWTAANHARQEPAATEREDRRASTRSAPAFAFASELLMIANVTSRPPMPGRTSSAMPPHGLPSLNAEEVGLHPVRPEVDGRGVVAEDVEQADQERRHRTTARGIVRFGSRVSSPSGAAASNPTNASRQKTMPWSAGMKPPSAGMKTDTCRPGCPRWR